MSDRTSEDWSFISVFDGQGGARRESASEYDHVTDEVCWAHLQRTSASAERWLAQERGIPLLVRQALTAEETRPRCTSLEGGLLLILRGVNLNPDSDPEDMVSIRIWTDGRQLLTVWLRRLLAVSDIDELLDHGRGPKNVGEFLALLADRLAARMEPVIAEIDDRIDALEDEVLESYSPEMRERLATVRRQAILLRRYFAPQREALQRLAGEQEAAPWLDQRERHLLRESADRITRYVEDLDAGRERASVVHDQLANHISDEMNRGMYILSVIAAVFLPLGFVTGLLGINVGGMPGVDSSWAFVAVCVLLAVLAGLEIWLLRRLKWL
ncbi:zinc transporter ZntB [Pelagibius marinus]|uniref:zinc transporter ZntB n=1 Tax=Pelagibius marinus TaxID=2762760 RepID=UPI00187279CA|nr:zinc transporter ZntB [Pelagibius marinus]